MKRVWLAMFLGSLLSVANCFGQAADGSVLGAVLDASGGAVPGASAELENTATGVKSAAKTDEHGLYRINNVLIGTYTLTVSTPGFTTASVKNVIVELNKVTT